MVGTLLTSSVLASHLILDHKPQNEQTTDSHRDDLECDTSNNHLIASVDEFLVLRPPRSGKASANALQTHGAEVAANEDPGIEARLEQRVLRAAVQDEVLEGKIDSGGDETGAQDQRADLQLEAALAPRVAVHHDAPDVAGAFEECPDSEGERVCPCFGPDPDDERGDEADAEEGAEEGVRAEVRAVAVESGVDGAALCDFDTLSEIAPGSVGRGGDEGDEACQGEEGGTPHVDAEHCEVEQLDTASIAEKNIM